MTNIARVSDQIQLARGILAELSEIGHRALTATQHTAVLLAFDHLEQAARRPWPPPPAPVGVGRTDAALSEARRALLDVLADLPRHDVEPLQAALALDHVSLALAGAS